MIRPKVTFVSSGMPDKGSSYCTVRMTAIATSQFLPPLKLPVNTKKAGEAINPQNPLSSLPKLVSGLLDNNLTFKRKYKQGLEWPDFAFKRGLFELKAKTYA